MTTDPWPMIYAECQRKGAVTITSSMAKEVAEQIDGKAIQRANTEIAMLRKQLVISYSQTQLYRRILNCYAGVTEIDHTGNQNTEAKTKPQG